VVITLLCAAVVAGCTESPPDTPEPDAGAEAAVSAGAPTTVQVDAITVTVPAGGAPEGSTLTLSTREPDAPDLPPEIQPVGQAAVATVDGGALSMPATVAFPLPAEVDGVDIVPMVLWQDTDDSWRWLPTDYQPGATTITATTDHFSWGFVATIDVRRWAEDRKTSVVNYLSSRSGVAQPTCGDEPAARVDGLQVSSDGGDSVKWCVGVQDGQRVLKVANNRRTYTEVVYPSGWQVSESNSVSFTPEGVSRALGTSFAFPPRGYAVRIVDGGDTLTLIVPDGASGQVQASASVLSWLIDALALGVETYSAVAKVAGSAGEAAAGSWDRIATSLTDLGAASSGYTEALKECGKAAGEFTDDELTDIAGDVLQLAWTCVPALMKADIEETGITFFAMGIVLAAIGTVVSAVLTAAHLVLTGLREVYDGLASFGGNSDAVYDIALVRPRPTPENTTVSLDGFGAVPWGASQADAEAALGSVFTTQDLGGGCSQASLDAFPGLTFGIQDGRLTVVAYGADPAGGPTPGTDTGLHIGDPIGAIGKAYPGISVGADPSDAYTTRYQDDEGGRTIQFLSFDQSTIDSIQVGLTGSVGEYPCV